MASYSVPSFTTLNDGFTTYGTRTWQVVSNHLFTPNESSDNSYYINNTVVDLNGYINVEYDNFDGTNGASYNGVVLRYIDASNNLVFRIEPRTEGNNDEQLIRVNSTIAGVTTTSEIEMYDLSGVNIKTRSYGYYIDIPTTGKVNITIRENYIYDIIIRTASDEFKCSGTYVDTRSNKNTNGLTGFWHEDSTSGGWNSGWNTLASPYGWKSIAWNDAAPAIYAPTILSYTADPASILEGNSSTVCWNITSGGVSTSASLNGAAVAISGCSAVSPTINTTYNISAWNSVGSTSASLLIDVSQQLPQIVYLSADYPKTTAGYGTYVYWQTNYSSSAVFNDELFVYPTSGVNTSAYPLSTPDVGIKTSYLSAFGPGIQTPAVSAITIETIARPSAISFTAVPTKSCIGSPFTVYWETSGAVSAVVAYGDDDDVWFDYYIPTSAVSSGSYTITNAVSASRIIWFGCDNELGIRDSSLYAAHVVNISPPVLSAEAYVGTTRIPDGGTVSITNPNGVDLLIETAGTIDPDGDSATFYFYNNSSLISSGAASNAVLTLTSASTNVIDVSAVDNCGNDATAQLTIYSTADIPPDAVVSNNSITIVKPQTITLVGSNSVAYSGKTISGYFWYTGTNLDVILSTDADPVVSITSPGVYKYKLYVVDSGNLSDFSDVLTIIYSPNTYGIEANAGADQKFCVDAGNTISSVTLDGSASTGALYYHWDLSEFGISSGANTAVVTLTNLSAANRNAVLYVSGADNIVDYDTTTVYISEKPIISNMWYEFNGTRYYSSAATYVEVPCNSAYAEIKLGVDVSNYPNEDLDFVWRKSYFWVSYYGTSRTTGGGVTTLDVPNSDEVVVSATQAIVDGSVYYPFYRCVVSLNSNSDCYARSDITPKVIDIDYGLTLDLDVYPKVINTSGGTFEPVEVSWTVTSADNVWLVANGVTTPVSAVDSTMVVVTYSQNIVLSATKGNCSKEVSIPVLVNDGDFIVCKLKEKYITIYTPDVIRYGTRRKINLREFFDYFQDREIYQFIGSLEGYLNTMYEGESGMTSTQTPLSKVEVTDYVEYLKSNFYRYEDL